jgi:aminoglycoside 6'-N-acetyltransferase Ib
MEGGAAGGITFRAMTRDDLPLFHEWLKRPHVAEWWPDRSSLEELEQEYEPVFAGAIQHRCFFAMLDGEPIGFIQHYTPAAFHDEGWWLDEHDPAVRGIDQFLANESQLNRGLGSAMVRAFVRYLFADPNVSRIQTDPDPRNARAIRCYEKAGFHAVGEVTTLDGPALLMYCDRAVEGRAR